jgi:hypothetical protein
MVAAYDPPARTDTLSGVGITTSDSLAEKATRETLTGHTQSERYIVTLSNGRQLVITVKGRPPRWLEPTVEALARILHLPPNWDSYNARPVSPYAAVNSIKLLNQVAATDTPPPQVVPTNRGGVQLEWHFPDIDLEIKVLSPERFSVSAEDFRTNEVWEDEQSSDLAQLREWLGRVPRQG